MKKPTQRKTKKQTKKQTKKPAKKTIKPKKATASQIRFARRLAELGISQHWLSEESLAISLEIDQVHGEKLGQSMGLQAIAMEAIEHAVFRSDDPKDWIAAGRAAGKLP